MPSCWRFSVIVAVILFAFDQKLSQSESNVGLMYWENKLLTPSHPPRNSLEEERINKGTPASTSRTILLFLLLLLMQVFAYSQQRFDPAGYRKTVTVDRPPILRRIPVIVVVVL